MRIRSTTVDGHQFTRSRRGGYDAAEVDAVMARIADTLRDYEDQTEDLEARIAAAATAARVTKPKPGPALPLEIEAAREHAAEIVRRAEEEAARKKAEITSLIEAARAEAETLRTETERARAEVEAERAGAEASRGRAGSDAAAIEQRARTDAEEIRTVAREEAQRLLSTALSQAQRLRVEAAADAAEIRQIRRIEVEAEIAARRHEVETQHLMADEEQRRTAAAAAAAASAAEEERIALESRLDDLRRTVGTIESQMRALAVDLADRASGIGGLAGAPHDASDAAAHREEPAADTPSASQPGPEPSVSPVSGFHAPDDLAEPGIAEPSAVFVIEDEYLEVDAEVAAGMETQTHAHHAYAEPDGSGRPPAERATIVPPELADGTVPSEDHHGPYRTVYQRAGRNLRARLRQEGQDPTQRGR